MRTIQTGTLILVCTVIFFNTFQNEFVWDDIFLIRDNRYIKDIKNIPLFFTPRYSDDLNHFPGLLDRPARTITFAVDYRLWKLNPAGYHLTNLLLHMAGVILAFYLVFFIGSGKHGDNQSAADGRYFFWSLPFLAALLFAAHPVHTESVTYIKNRSELLAFIFMLLSFLSYIRAVGGRPGPGLLLDISAWLFFLLAVFSKEVALVLPGLLVLYAFCFLEGTDRKRACLRIGPYGLLIILYFWSRRAVIGTIGFPVAESHIGLWQHFLIVIKTIGSYLKLLAFPVNLKASHIFIIPVSLWDPEVLFSAAIVLAVGLLAIMLYRRSRAAFFAVGWTLLTLIPAANIIFLESRPLAEQRLYIPSFGFCLLLACGLNRLFIGGRLRSAGKRQAVMTGASLAVIIVMAYSVITVRRNNDWRDPVTFFTRTIAGNPSSYRLHNNLGVELIETGRSDEAVRHFLTALRLKPDFAMTYNNLGVAYTDMNRLEEALSSFRIALELAPDFAEAQNNMSLALFKAERLEEAERFALTALNLKPDLAKAHFHLGRIMSGKGEDEAAQEHFKTALVLEPDRAWIYNSMGLYYMQEGRVEEAIQYYTKAIKIEPDYAEAYFNLAEVFSDQGQVEDAVTYYRGALRIRPYFTEAHINLGVILAETGQFQDAINHFSEALRLKPDSAVTHNNLGVALADSGYLEAAIKHYRGALRLDPDYAEAHNNLCAALARGGDPEEALKYCSSAIRLNPEDARAYSQMGGIFADRKDFEQALSCFAKALEIDPEDAGIHNNMGIVFIRQGRFDKAINHFNKALEIDPDYTPAGYNLGAALVDTGAYSQAAEILSALLRAHPDHPQAERKYQECLSKMATASRTQDSDKK